MITTGVSKKSSYIPNILSDYPYPNINTDFSNYFLTKISNVVKIPVIITNLIKIKEFLCLLLLWIFIVNSFTISKLKVCLWRNFCLFLYVIFYAHYLGEIFHTKYKFKLLLSCVDDSLNLVDIDNS